MPLTKEVSSPLGCDEPSMMTRPMSTPRRAKVLVMPSSVHQQVSRGNYRLMIELESTIIDDQSVTFDALRAFASFAGHLNFTRAAAELDISQPALHVKVRKRQTSAVPTP